MIYFWNDKQMALDLKNNIVPKRKKLDCFISCIFSLPGFYFITNSTSHPKEITVSFPLISNVISTSFIIIPAILLYISIYSCYMINEKGDGLNFFERYVCLFVPVSSLTAGLCLVPFALLFIAHALIGTWGVIAVATCGILFYLVYFFIRMNEVFKIASGQME